MPGGTAALDVAVPRLENQDQVGLVFVSVEDTGVVVTLKESVLLKQMTASNV